MGRMDVSFLATTRCGISGAGVCWSAASGSIAKENSRETNHWSDCDLCFVGGSFDAGAGSASGPHAGARSKEARIFYWNVEGSGHGSHGPEGKVTTTTKYEWLPGGFFVVGHSDGITSMGPNKEMSVMGWDPTKKMYSYHAFDSMGEEDSAKGTVNGDTWSWTADDMDGMPMKLRVTIKEVSKTEYTFKMDVSTDGNTWTTGMESTSTKVMPVTAK